MQSLLSTSTSATTFHVVQEGPVNALALNKDNTQVAIGGRNVFKVYTIEEDRFKEICNLRASKHLNLSFSCNDVSWSTTDDHYLATAATNGHVCVWNLTKMGKAMQEQDYQDHKRTVNKVNFHASMPNNLISGSQDGTMRYFDIRAKVAVAVFYSNTESVRDVQFSPHNPHGFAAVSDNGSVQLWDIRRPDKCQQQYTAHSGPVFACNWHPDMQWLATASRDKTIKVWDLTNKPTLEYTIHTFASIGHVKWRPQRKYHIASCALVVDCSINIWDVRRPYIPFAAFSEHRDFASGVAWRGDPHVFLSSGRDCTLYQHAFNDASRPASKAVPQGISINNKGEVLYAYKINVNNSSTTTKTTGIMRKSSTTVAPDQFHQAASLVLQFQNTSPQNLQEGECFIELAKNYMLNGRSLSEICDHNSNVAQKNGKTHIATVWKIVKTMYGEEYVQNSINSTNNNNNHHSQEKNKFGNIPSPRILENDIRSRSNSGLLGGKLHFTASDDPHNTTKIEDIDEVDHVPRAVYNNSISSYINIQGNLPKGEFRFSESELDIDLAPDFKTTILKFPQVDWTLPNEAFNIRPENNQNNRRSPSPDYPTHHSPGKDSNNSLNLDDQNMINVNLLAVSKAPKKTMWDPGNIIVEGLKYHASLGDVQTSASVLIVLGEQRKYLTKLDENTQEHWLLGYLELLSRFKLWNVSAQIIKLSWSPSVNSLNQQSTRISSNCSKCTKPLLRIGWLCDRCHSHEYGLCSVCHQVVKGLYTWCQGCSHGGHLMHMKQWIAKNKHCPTGCGHLCEYR